MNDSSMCGEMHPRVTVKVELRFKSQVIEYSKLLEVYDHRGSGPTLHLQKLIANEAVSRIMNELFCKRFQQIRIRLMDVDLRVSQHSQDFVTSQLLMDVNKILDQIEKEWDQRIRDGMNLEVRQ